MTTLTQTQNNFSYLTLPANKLYAVRTNEKPAENLLEQLQQKTERGFSLLYDNYADALFSVIYQIVNNREITEDLLQETFVKIWKKIDTYEKNKGTLYTWMLNIARNTGIDFIRSNKNRFYKLLIHDDLWQNEYLQPGREIGNADRLDYIAIKNKAAALDNKYAVVLDLIYFEGCTYEQVSKLLKLPVGTVKTRGRMALTLLKKAYK
jgi:RNA polymerase sigma-70 factor (ECF subfamily)